MRIPVLCLLAVLASTQAAAADWEDCRAQKLQSIRLENALRDGKLLRGYTRASDMRRERRRIDDWLWKHCRYYSSELRDVYRSQM